VWRICCEREKRNPVIFAGRGVRQDKPGGGPPKKKKKKKKEGEYTGVECEQWAIGKSQAGPGVGQNTLTSVEKS